jgi:hypothetical protein
MSDGGRDRASLGVGVRKSSHEWSVRRSAVRSIAWLDVWRNSELDNDKIKVPKNNGEVCRSPLVVKASAYEPATIGLPLAADGDDSGRPQTLPTEAASGANCGAYGRGGGQIDWPL